MRTQSATILLDVPPGWAGQWAEPLAELLPDVTVLMNGTDSFAPESIDFLVTFRPTPGLIKQLGALKAVFSLGAGVDGIVSDPDYPRDVPLTRFVDHTLTREMGQYVVMHELMHHLTQRYFDAAQALNKWRQRPPPRTTEDTRIGILGLGELGVHCAARLREHEFTILGWSRTKKDLRGVESFAGAGELAPFLARTDILVCLLPLTRDTTGILNAKTFALMPKGGFVINVARGGHLIEADLVDAIDTGHLSGATLDVFQTEPLPRDNILWNHPRITVTPHVAAITDPRAASSYIAANVAALQRGDALENVIDLARGY